MKRWEIYLEILCEIILLIGGVFLIGFVLPKTLAFLWPLVLGWIIAMLGHPIQKFLQKKLKVSRRIGSAVIVVLVLLFVSGVIYLAGAKLIDKGVDFVEDVPGIYHETEANIKKVWGNIKEDLPQPMAKKIGDIAGRVASEITTYFASGTGAGYLSSFAKSATNGIIGIIVMFMSAYFFMADWEALHKRMENIESDGFKKRYALIKENILGAVGGYFLAQLKLMGIIFILLLIAFLILHVNYSVVLAILISLLDALPFFGVGTALIPWSIYKFFSGEAVFAIALIALYVICLLTRQILQPRIVGKSVGLSSLTTLVLMYVGVKLGGIVGFIIAVIVGIIVKRMYESGMFDGSIKRMQDRFDMLKDAQ